MPHQHKTKAPKEWIDRSSVLSNWTALEQAPIAAYVDSTNRWTVQVFPVRSTDGTPWQGTLRVGIKYIPSGSVTNDEGGEIVLTWSEIQDLIKDQFWPDRIAMEIFPPKEQVVNVAPMRWLWVLPPGAELPFNLSGAMTRMKSKRKDPRPRSDAMHSEMSGGNPEEIVSSIVVHNMRIVDWCPDKEAKAPPEAVGILLETNKEPILVRMKSPAVVDETIAAMAAHRDSVWPDEKRNPTNLN